MDSSETVLLLKNTFSGFFVACTTFPVTLGCTKTIVGHNQYCDLYTFGKTSYTECKEGLECQLIWKDWNNDGRESWYTVCDYKKDT